MVRFLEYAGVDPRVANAWTRGEGPMVRPVVRVMLGLGINRARCIYPNIFSIHRVYFDIHL